MWAVIISMCIMADVAMHALGNEGSFYGIMVIIMIALLVFNEVSKER